jgi:hypothetical protein
MRSSLVVELAHGDRIEVLGIRHRIPFERLGDLLGRLVHRLGVVAFERVPDLLLIPFNHSACSTSVEAVRLERRSPP